MINMSTNGTNTIWAEGNIFRFRMIDFYKLFNAIHILIHYCPLKNLKTMQ